jgi:ssDNA-binding Zn-finger/Zn-ribbon topoisomerase 1
MRAIAMAEHKRVIQVPCPECGLRTELHVKASGLESVITETIPKCRHELTGSDVLQCPRLKLAIAAANQSLR